MSGTVLFPLRKWENWGKELFKKNNAAQVATRRVRGHIKLKFCNPWNELAFRTTPRKLLSVVWAPPLLVKGISYISQSVFAPLRPSGIAVSFLNSDLNKEAHVCSISGPFQMVPGITPYTVPLASTGFYLLLMVCSSCMSAFWCPLAFSPLIVALGCALDRAGIWPPLSYGPSHGDSVSCCFWSVECSLQGPGIPHRLCLFQGFWSGRI